MKRARSCHYHPENNKNTEPTTKKINNFLIHIRELRLQDQPPPLKTVDRDQSRVRVPEICLHGKEATKAINW